MDFSGLSAVGPGIMQGEQQQALLQQRQIENQQAQMALQQLMRQRQGAQWMNGGGMADAFNAQNPSRPGGAPAPQQPVLPRDTPQPGAAGAPPAPLAAPGVAGGMPAPMTPPAAGPSGGAPPQMQQPAAAPDAGGQQDQGLEQYDPLQSMRMVMGLADFIQQRYKASTGQDMDPQTLMEQVERVANLSNKFTPAQRLGMQGSIAQLRADTSSNNTDKRVGAQRDIADLRADTSTSNTDKRVSASRDIAGGRNATALAVAGGHDATSRANTGDRVTASNDRAAMVDTRQRELADAQNKLKADIAANRDTTASRNALNSAKSRLDTARIQMGQAPTESLDDSGAAAPAPKPAKGGGKAWTPPAGLPAPTGVAEGTKARGVDGKVAAVIKGGKWTAPPAGS